MELWNNVINTAMLGTDKGALNAAVFPSELEDINKQLIDGSDMDKESLFLNQASLAFNYRQCGFITFKKESVDQPKALSEEKSFCSSAALEVLKAILDAESTSLLEYWLNLCATANKLIEPDVLTDVLDKAAQHPRLQPLTVACSGNLGIWLSGFNPQWNFFNSVADEEIWATGKPDDRVKLLQRIRQNEPQKAREWLQQTWAQEAASAKADLLKTLSINIGEADLTWLEGLLNEKGQKVKDEVMALLKLIPSSSIIQQYQQILAASVSLKKSKGLLGMMSKTSLQIQLTSNIDEGIYKTGIEKLSNSKTVTDEEFTLYQLAAGVPPSFWEKHLESTAEEIAGYFNKDDAGKKLFPAIGVAASLFKEVRWAPHFLKLDGFYIDLAQYLDSEEHGRYFLRFFDREPRDVIHHAAQSKKEWSTALAAAIFQYQANNPYQYTKSFYEQNILLIPVKMLNQLDGLNPKDANHQATWVKNRDYLTKLLTLKQNAQQAFNH